MAESFVQAIRAGLPLAPRHGRPPMPEGRRVSENFKVRMTRDMADLVYREAARRQTTGADVIREAIGVYFCGPKITG